MTAGRSSVLLLAVAACKGQPAHGPYAAPKGEALRGQYSVT